MTADIRRVRLYDQNGDIWTDYTLDDPTLSPPAKPGTWTDDDGDNASATVQRALDAIRAAERRGER